MWSLPHPVRPRTSDTGRHGKYCPLPCRPAPYTMHGSTRLIGGAMAAELWAVALAAQVEAAIAQGRRDAAARDALSAEFATTYAGFSGSTTPGYWNNYLTWTLVQTLALRRWPEMSYALRDAAALILRFLHEPDEQTPRTGPFAFLRPRPRPVGGRVPEARAVVRLLATLGGAVAEARAAALSPGADPTYTEEGALYFSDAERDRVLAALPALRSLLIESPFAPRFHFWVVRQPGVARALRDALTTPTHFLADVEAIFGCARDLNAQVFVLRAP